MWNVDTLIAKPNTWPSWFTFNSVIYDFFLYSEFYFLSIEPKVCTFSKTWGTNVCKTVFRVIAFLPRYDWTDQQEEYQLWSTDPLSSGILIYVYPYKYQSFSHTLFSSLEPHISQQVTCSLFPKLVTIISAFVCYIYTCVFVCVNVCVYAYQPVKNLGSNRKVCERLELKNSFILVQKILKSLCSFFIMYIFINFLKIPCRQSLIYSWHMGKGYLLISILPWLGFYSDPTLSSLLWDLALPISLSLSVFLTSL